MLAFIEELHKLSVHAISIMPDETLVQTLHDKRHTELTSRSCGLRLKGKPTKLIFASEIVNDMRTIYAVSERFLNRYEKAFTWLWSIRVRPKDD